MAWYHARILELMRERTSATCGFSEQGQSRMVEMLSMATLLLARTLSMLGEGAGDREEDTDVQEVNRTCRLCSVVKARLMQSCWRWW